MAHRDIGEGAQVLNEAAPNGSFSSSMNWAISSLSVYGPSVVMRAAPVGIANKCLSYVSRWC